MTILERDRAVFNALKALGAEDKPVWLEDLCRYLRETGYETPRRGSIVREAGFVCAWFANRPAKGYMGYRIVRVQPDLYKLES